jgi:transcriptional regulator with XRE-family HTH domain
MSFAERLKELLAERGWQAVHLAAALADLGVQVTPQSVENWLSGTHEPRMGALRALSTALDVSVDYLCALSEYRACDIACSDDATVPAIKE